MDTNLESSNKVNETKKTIIDITSFNINNLDRCNFCQGIGLIKYEIIKCFKCEGKKCFECKSNGLIKMPYDECDKCYGTGKKIY